MASPFSGLFSLDDGETGSHVLDLFSPPAVDKSISEGITRVYRPINTAAGGPHRFNITKEPRLYTLPDSIRLCGDVRLMHADGSAMVETETKGTDANGKAIVTGTVKENACLSCLPFHSLYKSLEVELEHVQVPALGSEMLHYKSYIEKLFSYGMSASDTQLSGCECFMLDTEGQMETCEIGEGNEGFDERAAVFAKSAKVDFSIPLHASLTSLARAIPDVCDIGLNFVRADDKFAVMRKDGSAHNYMIELTNLRLFVRKVRIHDKLYAEHQRLFAAKKQTILPFMRTAIKQKVVTQGSNMLNWASCFTGELPSSIIMGMVKMDSISGTQESNPYNFQHFGCSKVQLKVNGSTCPAEGYNFDIANGKCSRAYRELFDSVGIGLSDVGHSITRSKFEDGYFLLPFDLTPSALLGPTPFAPQNGNIDLDLEFKTGLDETITVMLFACFGDTLRLDGAGKAKLGSEG